MNRTSPMPASVIDALTRRAAAQQGEARAWMEQRIAQWQAQAAAAPSAPRHPPHPDRDALAGLSELIDRLGRSPSSTVRQAETPGPTAARPSAVTAFKGTWSRLRAEQRLRHALAQVPAQAGPLNSSHVVHVALKTMHALSPDYLDAFMAHADALLELDQASGGGLVPRPANRTDGPRRASTRAGRKA